jgi:hypothetical protein
MSGSTAVSATRQTDRRGQEGDDQGVSGRQEEAPTRLALEPAEGRGNQLAHCFSVADLGHPEREVDTSPPDKYLLSHKYMSIRRV